MSDLIDQLREYGSELDHATPGLEHLASNPTSNRVRRREWTFAVVAAAIMLIVVGSVPLLLARTGPAVTPPGQTTAGTSSAPVSTTEAPTTTQPPSSTTTQPVSIPEIFREGWTHVDPAQSGLATTVLGDVFVSGDRLIATGLDDASGRSVFASGDGLHWEIIGHVTGEVELGQSDSVVRRRSFEGGLLTLVRTGSVGAEVWLGRFDGSNLVWQLGTEVPGACCMMDLAISNGTMVIVSQKVNHIDNEPGVWWSIDGVTWEQVPPESLPIQGTLGFAFVDPGGPGFVGSFLSEGTVYVSDDGTHWFLPHDYTASNPDFSSEEPTLVRWGGYRKLCKGATGPCSFSPITSLADIDGGHLAIRPGDGSLGYTEDGTNWVWWEHSESALGATPRQVISWGGRFVVITDGHMSLTWEPTVESSGP